MNIVNETHQSILPKDVLDHFGEVRNPSGYYAERVKFQARKAAEQATNEALEKRNARLEGWLRFWDFVLVTAAWSGSFGNLLRIDGAVFVRLVPDASPAETQKPLSQAPPASP